MHIQDSQWSGTSAIASGGGGGGGSSHTTTTDGTRTSPLRVDAQRNLEHVLRAAREVFGELGYGAPMEDVARRARVGVGTVYRRFPSKDVLVRRIAEEETARLADQALAALGQEDEPWSALSRFLRTSVASGAGRLLPPQILRVEVDGDDLAAESAEHAAGSEREGSGADGLAAGRRVPQQRTAAHTDAGSSTATAAGQRAAGPDLRLVGRGTGPDDRGQTPGSASGSGSGSGEEGDGALEEPGARALLDVVGRLVERARDAGELREDVTVSDVLLVIATAAPALPDPAQQAAASGRLLDILLEGLRSRPA
ncbi:TetR/AcrR family transcriptional regulator [Streptomyces odontomachi]|uniref:TetR/AcrR family transcriptional regulator n=1 Tax=Streptomyces odontomachi TaxID=2944940 RepID=UPI00210D1ED5|nr:TetR/AcrR family transcriptional regulator [Streptomyces sp. ODS25]